MNGSLFGYVQWELLIPDEFKPVFSNFPQIFKNFDACRNNIGEYMKNYVAENDLLKNLQRILISCFKLEIETIITPLLKLLASKFIGFLSKNLGNVSTTLFNLLLLLDEKETRIHILELLLGRWRFSVTARTVIKLWTKPDTQKPIISAMRRHKEKNENFYKRLKVVKKKLIRIKTIEVNNWTWRTNFRRLLHSSTC